MRVLLIACHPRADSFCLALAAAGHVVEFRDLHAEGFRPVMAAAEHALCHTPGANEAAIEAHAAARRRAEALVLVCPTWWYGMPAMLKGWFDRVWLNGIAFRLGAGAIEPGLANIRRIAVVTSYGSPDWLLWMMGRPEHRLMRRGLRRLCARGCRLDWLYLMRMDRRGRGECEAFLARVGRHFAGWR